VAWFRKPSGAKGTAPTDPQEALPAPEKAPDDSTVVIGEGGPRPRVADDADERIHYLVVVEGSERGSGIQLGADPVVLGRLPPAHLVLTDRRVSRSHCSVSVVLDAVVVTDLGSTNGTFIDGKRVSGAVALASGARLEVGDHRLKLESRSRGELEEARRLERELASAGRYVQSLLPAELTEGPVSTEWILLPSNRLGGDAFGYHSVDPDNFAIYLIDVCGHGPGAALHAVSMINALRQQALPDTDFRNPAAVLKRLNGMFQMDRHGGMYATLWYGVYDIRARTLVFCSAGHHPGFLVLPERNQALPLMTANIVVGVTDDFDFKTDRIEVPFGSKLYVFSDGVFEIVTGDGLQWGIADFVPLLLEPMTPGTPEPVRLHQAVRERAGSTALEDDFSMVVLTFS